MKKLHLINSLKASVDSQAKFVKAQQSDVIKVIFSLYDSENKGYIEKDEFIKMLYNYP